LSKPTRLQQHKTKSQQQGQSVQGQVWLNAQSHIFTKALQPSIGKDLGCGGALHNL
jgi:hypothetical protein